MGIGLANQKGTVVRTRRMTHPQSDGRVEVDARLLELAILAGSIGALFLVTDGSYNPDGGQGTLTADEATHHFIRSGDDVRLHVGDLREVVGL